MSVTFAWLDNVALTNPPSTVRIVSPDLVLYPGSNGAMVAVQPLTPPRIEVTWGISGAVPAAIAELITKRGQKIHHVFEWIDEVNTEHRIRNVAIPQISYGQGPGFGAIDPFTLVMQQITPNPLVDCIELYVPGTIATGDGQAHWEAISGGRILKVKGTIQSLGTGTGQTRIQVSNGATDYLSTRGDFVVASATRRMENQVLAASSTFNRGEVIDLDIDGIPSGADSSGVSVLLYVLRFEA